MNIKMEILKESNNYDFYWKVLLLGPGSVGKTAFCKRIVNNYDDFMKYQNNVLFCINNTDYIFIYIKYLNRMFKL